MTQQEFETRIGTTVTPETFDFANRTYMAAGNMDKDAFCEDWKLQYVSESEIVKKLTLEVESLQKQIKALSTELTGVYKSLDRSSHQVSELTVERDAAISNFRDSQKSIDEARNAWNKERYDLKSRIENLMMQVLRRDLMLGEPLTVKQRRTLAEMLEGYED